MLDAIFDALEFAAIQHQYQGRGGYERLPYINHLIKVARILIHTARERDEDVLRAAILHDILEDTEVSPAQLTALFGKKVCEIVQELTDDMELSYAERKRIQIEKAAQLSLSAKKIKIADKSCNIRDIVDYPLHWNRTQKIAYLDWSAEVIDQFRGELPALEAYFEESLKYGRTKLGLHE